MQTGESVSRKFKGATLSMPNKLYVLATRLSLICNVCASGRINQKEVVDKLCFTDNALFRERLYRRKTDPCSYANLLLGMIVERTERVEVERQK